MEFLFTENLNNWHIVKQQNNPFNNLYFYPSQPGFYSCQKIKYNTTLTKVYL